MDPRELMDPGGPDAAARSQKSPRGGCYEHGTEAVEKERNNPQTLPQGCWGQNAAFVYLSIYILFFKWERFYFKVASWITAKSKVPATWVPRSAHWVGRGKQTGLGGAGAHAWQPPSPPTA